MNTLHLPYPLSANRYWKSAYIPRLKRVQVYPSKEALNYKKAVRAIAYGTHLCSDPCWVTIVFHPKLTKEGGAYKRRLDLDNVLKVTLDALNGVAFVDDSLVHDIHISLGDPIEGGGVTFHYGLLMTE